MLWSFKKKRDVRADGSPEACGIQLPTDVLGRGHVLLKKVHVVQIAYILFGLVVFMTLETG